MIAVVDPHDCRCPHARRPCCYPNQPPVVALASLPAAPNGARDLCSRRSARSHAFDVVPEGRDRAREHLCVGKLKQAAPDHAIKERHFVVVPGKAVRAAARSSRRADVPERLFASSFIADSPERLCNQLPRGGQRLINPTFIVFIPGQCGFPQNLNAETAVDRFKLSRR